MSKPSITEIEKMINADGGKNVRIETDGMVVVRAPMTASLEAKLAAVINYIDNHAKKRVQSDDDALHSYLDDAEVADWLDKMRKEDRVKPDRFISK